MKLNISILSSLLGLAYAALDRRTGCNANNCLRELRATSMLAKASVDCSSFFVKTITPLPVTVTVISTVNGPAKRDSTQTSSGGAIPTYASKCTDADQYASACSCIGVTAATTTIAASSTTVTATVTAAPCTGQTCSTGFIPKCNLNNSNCFCFTNAAGNGFCGQNAPCAGLTACETDSDCAVKDSSGDTCALSTCCGDAGICLEGICPNPSTKLRRMAKEVGRSHLEADTAASRGH